MDIFENVKGKVQQTMAEVQTQLLTAKLQA